MRWLRITVVLSWLAVPLELMAGEPVDSLMRVEAPAGEFVKMPPKYVMEKLAEAARNSGESALSGFSFAGDIAGMSHQRMTLSFDGMSLHMAMCHFAKAVGAKVVFSPRQALLSVAEKEAPAAPRVDPDVPMFSFIEIGMALVDVECGDKCGSGFVMAFGGEQYVLTTQTSFFGADKPRLRSLGGRYLKPVSFEFCGDRNLARFKLAPDDLEGLSVLRPSDWLPVVGRNTSAYTGTQGVELAAEMPGTIVRVTDHIIGLEMGLDPVDSGSPVLDAYGNVLGVSSRCPFGSTDARNDVRRQLFAGSCFDVSRPVAIRIPLSGWEEGAFDAFLKQGAVLADLRNLLDAAYVLTQLWLGDEGVKNEATVLFSACAANRSSKQVLPYTFNHSAYVHELEMLVGTFHGSYTELRGKRLEKLDVEKQSKQITLGLRRSTANYRAVLSRMKWASPFLKKMAGLLEKQAAQIEADLDSLR